MPPGAGRAAFEGINPDIICHRIKIAKPGITIQPPKQPRTPAELRSHQKWAASIWDA
jgi:hypothetical protein